MKATVARCAALLILAGCATPPAAPAKPQPDRRTPAAYQADQALETRLNNRLKVQLGNKANVKAYSFNRFLLLTGEVPDSASRAKAQEVVGQENSVRLVFNETQIAEPSIAYQNARDQWLFKEAQQALEQTDGLAPRHVRLVVKNNVAYLMGIVNRREAALAEQRVAATVGIARVISLFEYLD